MIVSLLYARLVQDIFLFEPEAVAGGNAPPPGEHQGVSIKLVHDMVNIDMSSLEPPMVGPPQFI